MKSIDLLVSILALVSIRDMDDVKEQCHICDSFSCFREIRKLK